MKSFEVTGGNRLKGIIVPQGAKNEALQVLCAVLLTPERVVISNIPDIIDVRLMIEILAGLGVVVERISDDTYSFVAAGAEPGRMYDEEMLGKANMLRGSVMLAGPLLARFKSAVIPRPGGDKIGRRRLDTHITGFEQLGCIVDYDPAHEYFRLSAGRLRGTEILLDEPSVTATANLILASVMAEGETVIYNAACEPYIQQLCLMLNRMGAEISGIKSNLLTINGVSTLRGCSHRILPDMIEVGSFIGMAAVTGSELRIKDAGTAHLGIVPQKFMQLGIDLRISGDDILIPSQDTCEIRNNLDGSVLTIYDHPWPGLSPDLISVMLVVAVNASGSVLIHQKMFESRLFFVDKLIDMGARIILCDPHRAAVIGLGGMQRLRGITMSSPDIRAGMALLIAAMGAEGKSMIHNIEQIDRGYQDLDRRLNELGAQIRRVDS
ncbi:MAG: UDP-N-acetylglucosamine 1-carboxyvinyltransferase [Bacteroidales bacterium]|jgi:UDP-N-acetylglucosamine 1-carboxyvinyltransferase|nr:UDP-N-acetylglucosamine 1-carboxyvinyltransferase [Bacteroidales bacterium]